MAKGRKTKLCAIDGNRCSINNCKKLAKDIIAGKHLCRLHSPMRDGFKKKLEEKKKKK